MTLDGSRVSGMVTSATLPGRGWRRAPTGCAASTAPGTGIGYGDAVTGRRSISADVESGQLELRLVRRRK